MPSIFPAPWGSVEDHRHPEWVPRCHPGSGSAPCPHGTQDPRSGIQGSHRKGRRLDPRATPRIGVRFYRLHRCGWSDPSCRDAPLTENLCHPSSDCSGDRITLASRRETPPGTNLDSKICQPRLSCDRPRPVPAGDQGYPMPGQGHAQRGGAENSA